jgi:molybdenum cofactor biosynthesis enzyme MoaA
MLRPYAQLMRGLVKNAIAQRFAPSRAFPYRLGLSVTNRCNHRCKTCGIWRTARESPGPMQRELRLEEFEAFFRSYRCGLCWMGVAGGEPT